MEVHELKESLTLSVANYEIKDMNSILQVLLEKTESPYYERLEWLFRKFEVLILLGCN